MATAKERAPKSVQESRRIIRQECGFRRGVNPTADKIVDDCLVWLLDDVFDGRITSREEAARALGDYLSSEIRRS